MPPLTRCLFISHFVFRVCFWLVRLLILFELGFRRKHDELFYSTTAILHRFYERLSFLKHPNIHVGPFCFVRALVLRKQIQCSSPQDFCQNLSQIRTNQNKINSSPDTLRLKWICISADDSILFRLYLGSKAALTANLAQKQKLKQKPFWRAYTGDFIILSPFYRFTPFLAVRSLMQLKGWPKLAVMTGKLVYRQIAQFVCYFFMGPLVECIG